MIQSEVLVQENSRTILTETSEAGAILDDNSLGCFGRFDPRYWEISFGPQKIAIRKFRSILPTIHNLSNLLEVVNNNQFISNPFDADVFLPINSADFGQTLSEDLQSRIRDLLDSFLDVCSTIQIGLNIGFKLPQEDRDEVNGYEMQHWEIIDQLREQKHRVEAYQLYDTLVDETSRDEHTSLTEELVRMAAYYNLSVVTYKQGKIRAIKEFLSGNWHNERVRKIVEDFYRQIGESEQEKLRCEYAEGGGTREKLLFNMSAIRGKNKPIYDDLRVFIETLMSSYVHHFPN